MNEIKRFKDYMNDELLALTENEIEELIRLEYAFGGIAITMEEPIWKEGEIVIPKVRAYTICDVTVLSLKRAEAILDVLTSGNFSTKPVQIMIMIGSTWKKLIPNIIEIHLSLLVM